MNKWLKLTTLLFILLYSTFHFAFLSVNNFSTSGIPSPLFMQRYGEVELTVRVVNELMGDRVPIQGVSVQLLELGVEGYTDLNGVVKFRVPPNYGWLTVKTFAPGFGWKEIRTLIGDSDKILLIIYKAKEVSTLIFKETVVLIPIALLIATIAIITLRVTKRGKD